TALLANRSGHASRASLRYDWVLMCPDRALSGPPGQGPHRCVANGSSANGNTRSEERRVGKEWRRRCAPDHYTRTEVRKRKGDAVHAEQAAAGRAGNGA